MYNILQVDDDRELAEVTADFLKREGNDFDVSIVTSAESGLERLEEEDVDCVVSDYQMPGMDGLAFLDRVRETYPDLPFILFTGKGSEEVASEAIAHGVTDYLQKGAGTEQYELLANRCTNAIEQYHAQRRAANLDRIRDVIRDVNQALVRAEDRTELEQRVCERLAAADPCRFAWIGALDDDRTVVPRASAGIDEDYLSEIEVTSEDEPTGRGPTGKAVRTGKLQVLQNIHEDPEYEPWRRAAEERGFSASAAVPFVHDGEVLGVLNVYADRTHAFDEDERELLAELGEDIAQGLHTQRVQADLHRANARLEALFAKSPDAVVVHDAEGTVLDVNDQTVENLGYSRNELVGTDVFEFEVGNNPEELRTVWAEMDTGERGQVAGEHERKDGTTFPVEVWLSKLEIDGSERLIALSRDVSDRKERERALERYERLVQNLPVGVYQNTPGPDGAFTLLNDAMVDLFDAESRDELRTHSISDLYVDPDDREAFSDKLVEEGVVKSEELQLETLTGEQIWGSVTAIARKVDGHTVFDGAIQDITERKEYEQQLKHQRDDLELLNQVLRHDIRNDLQLVLAYAELLAEQVEGEPKEYVATVLESADHAVELTKTAREMADVLLTPRDDSHSVGLRRILESELDEIRSIYADAAVTVDGTIPSVSVLGDDMLDSVFRNLLKNAVQHNDSEVPEVTLSVTTEEDIITIAVADNGPGVPDDQKEEIFGKGEKGLESQGTGIGLYLVKTLVESYGGEVWVEDVDPTGASFVVELQRSG